MKRCALFGCVALSLSLVVVMSCRPRETPEQKLERLREAHQIIPTGATTIYDDEGAPSVIVDMSVTNQSAEPLPHLTVLVCIRGEGGVEKVAERVSLDLEGVRPGVGVQRDVRIAGFELGEHDEVTVALESGLPADELRTFPEFVAVSGDSD